ncbi:TVP38/TMEM64 family protein [Parvibaculum sp.]|uniref:TVP38/TMEM64 family protein n=1 Tax=Parvibaculum sp. TaxID=2024848 RepID=UPI003BA9D832
MSKTIPAGPAEEQKKSLVGPIVAGVAVIAVLATAFALLPVGQWLATFQAWVHGQGAAGWVIYALVYAACVVLFVPASILTLGAGAIYGVGVGVLVVLAGATLGAALAFLLARTLLRERVEHMTRDNARFRALDRAIAKEGAKIVFLVRLAPIFPFTYINYAFGLTGVPTPGYVLASFFGMIPGTFAYVYLGSAAASAASGGAGGARTVVQVLGAVAAIAVTVFVARIATRAIREAGVDEAASA